MLSTLPKLADRSFIIGFLLPTILAITVGFALFADPAETRELLKAAKDDTALLLMTLGGTWLLAVLLLILNRGIYRCLEGYLPPLKWHKRARRKAARRIDTLRDEAKRLNTQLAATPDAEAEKLYVRRLRELAQLPPAADEAFPTRFGNAIRAFELYPREVYGADGVGLWLRVAPYVPAVLLDTVAVARSQIDFMVNCAFFSFLFSISAACQFLIFFPFHDFGNALRAHEYVKAAAFVYQTDLLWSGLSMVAMYSFYRFAVVLVPAWGGAFKACFDVGLPELAAKLGFTLPDTEAKRRQFWSTLSQTAIYTTWPDRSPIFYPEDWLPPKKPTPGILQRLRKWLFGSPEG